MLIEYVSFLKNGISLYRNFIDQMKYSELHRKILKNGWKYSHAEGSHYFYIKDGKISIGVPYHGAKEIGEGLRMKIIKEMELR